MSDFVKVDIDNGIAIVTLHRPEAYNAFHLEMMDPFACRLTELATNDAVRAVVLTGAGKAFCAGGDLKSVTTASDGPNAALHRLAARFHAAIIEIRRMPKPVIAAVNGVAAGGGFTLALAADFRVIAKSVVMRCAYNAAGLCIDGGGTWILPRLVGPHRALEIAVLDAPITAGQALEWGLVTKVADDGQALEAALVLARDFMQRALNSFAQTKRLLLSAFETPLERQLEHEREAIAACSLHPDGAEGLAAFVEKRKPVFDRERP